MFPTVPHQRSISEDPHRYTPITNPSYSARVRPTVELPIPQVGPSQLYCDSLQVAFHSFGIDQICCGNLNDIDTVTLKLLADDTVDLSAFGIPVDSFR